MNIYLRGFYYVGLHNGRRSPTVADCAVESLKTK